MNADDPQLPMYYIHQVVELVSGMEIDVPTWLARHRLDEARIADPVATLSFHTFHDLIRDAMSLTHEPALGLLIGERLLLSSHGILGYAALNSATIRQAVELFERYITLRTPLVRLHIQQQGRTLRLVFEECQNLGDIHQPFLEAVILTVKNVLDYISLGVRHVQMVAFPFDKPAYAPLARDLFQCEVQYRQDWAGFAIPISALDFPLKMNDPTTFREATRICQDELEKLSQNTTLSTRVRRLMLEKSNGFPSLNVTARLLHLTPRTLHRRLLEEGVSFKEILDDLRFGIASGHLRESHLSVQEIAYTLGYTDISNFRRAFRRWSGLTPTEFRAQRE